MRSNGGDTGALSHSLPLRSLGVRADQNAILMTTGVLRVKSAELVAESLR
jgi:hypothetical protein